MNGGIADDTFRVVDSDEQHVRRHVIRHELIPVLGREHGLGDEFAQVGPARPHGSVEHRPESRSVPGNSTSEGNSRRGLVHETPPVARKPP